MGKCFTAIRRAGVTVALAAVCPFAAAGIQPHGDLLTGGSWGQRFDYAYFGPSDEAVEPMAVGPRNDTVDLVAVSILSGGPFEAPTFRGFDVAGWDNWAVYPAAQPQLAAAGTYTHPTATLSFELWFDAESVDPVSFLFAAWHPGELAPFEAFQVSWNSGSTGGVWAVEPSPWSPGGPNRMDLDPPALPVPAAALLGAIGLGLVGWIKRRLS